MKKVRLATLLFSGALLISCGSQKTANDTNGEGLNYGVELPNEHSQVVNKAKTGKDLTDYLRTVPGVLVKGSGAGAEISIRGDNSLGLSNEPLFVINGQQLYEPFSSIYFLVPPNQIKSVTVLKDAGTLAIYGSSGANGVIEIITAK